MSRMADHDNPVTREAPDAVVLRFPSPVTFPSTATPEDILAALAGTWMAPLTAYAVAFARISEDEADDVVQQAFVEVWNRHVSAGRAPKPNHEAALVAAVRGRLLAARRTRRRRRALLKAGNYAGKLMRLVRDWMLPSERLDARELWRIVDEALEEMPPRCRELQILHRHGGKTVEEIASALDMTPNGVAVLLQRGNRILRKRLEKAGYSPEGRRAAAKMKEIR